MDYATPPRNPRLPCSWQLGLHLDLEVVREWKQPWTKYLSADWAGVSYFCEISS